MAEVRPRTRGKNFTKKDKEVLSSLFRKYSYVIEIKERDGFSDMYKAKAWSVLTAEFNTMTGAQRNVGQLKKKWQLMKKKSMLPSKKGWHNQRFF